MLFLFITYGLYKGIGIIDNFPKFRDFKKGDILGNVSPDFDAPSVEVGEGISGIIISILLWIVMTFVIIVLLIVFEAVFWFSLFIIIATLYWGFFRALKLVFSKSTETKNRLGVSVSYALVYTTMYLGWIFGIVYLTEVFR